MASERIYLYDNVKFFCIILVVIGHAIGDLVNESGFLTSLFLLIYSFHMPIFLFISGLFQKPLLKTSKFNLNKFTFFLVVGYLIKIITFIIKSSVSPKAVINWFGGGDLPWFMMVMALYQVVIFLISRVKIHPLIILAISILLGGVCGYFSFIGDRFWLSRFFVFLPFYLAGYYLTPQKMIDFTRKLYVRIPAILLSAFWIYLCFWNRTLVYPLRPLFTGRNSFVAIKSVDFGFEHRMLCYVITAIFCIAVLSVIPNIKIPLLTHMGKNTLAVFFWHRMIIYILDYTGVFDALLKLPHYTWMALVLGGSAVLGFVLMFDVFSWPLNKLQKLINGKGKRSCIILLVIILIFGIAFTIREGI